MENEGSDSPIAVQVIPNGPLKVVSSCQVQMPGGETVAKENAAFFCRCGASENKPFCDGAHKRIEFSG